MPRRCKPWGSQGIRQHDFRRTFIALHVEVGTHPKLVQDRVGHSNVELTMAVYGAIAGRIALAQEQEARLDVNTAADSDPKPAMKSDPGSVG